jgi:uncharacterized lipoprotein
MITGLLCLALLLSVSGCHMLRSKIDARACNETQTYASERSVPPLKVPSGVDSPDAVNALRLPQLNEPAPPPRPRSARCLDEPPSFKVQKAPQA